MKKNYSDKIVPEIDWDIGVFCAQKDSSKEKNCLSFWLDVK